MIRPPEGFPKPWRRPNEYFAAYPMELSYDYREAAGPRDLYDVKAAMQFCLLIALGLREYHRVLDIGCGSLRLGRLLIPYLSLRRYYGVDPMEWMIEAGIEHEVGDDLVEAKQPVFSNDEEFDLTQFGPGRFDYLIAQSVFSHAPQWMIRKCLAEAAKAMVGHGVFAATYLPGSSDFQGQEFSPGAPYRFAFFAEEAIRVGLACAEIPWPHNGQKWLLFAHPNWLEEMVHRAKNPLQRLARTLKE